MPLHYYNEWEPYAAEWLRNLGAAGHIPAGQVDERSIEDVQAKDLEGVTQAHFFAGIGGWPLALKLAGWPADLPVWTGSCPCQPFSCAGKAGGVGDKRHLWPAFLRLISECRPPVVFGEQVADEDGRLWLSGVRVDLEKLGYAVGTADLCAAGVGAPHIRQRLYWVADAGRGAVRGGGGAWERPGTSSQAEGEARERQRGWVDAGSGGVPCGVGHTGGGGREIGRTCGTARESGQGDQGSERSTTPSPLCWDTYEFTPCGDGKTRRFEPGSFPLADGVPSRMGKLRAYGNAIVPPLAAEFVKAYLEA